MAVRICIVDDDKDFAESMALAIEKEEYQIDLAFSGEEAIQKSRQNHYDITFMDFKLPGKNGVESFLEIREFKPRAKIVLMTGYALDHLLKKALLNGALDILKKPLDLHKISQLIEDFAKDEILVVDDDSDFTQTLKDIFKDENKKIYIAYSAKEAIEYIEQKYIDVLILDPGIPMVDKIAACQKLIQNQIPILIVSAYIDEKQEIENLPSSLISGIIKKPIEPQKFLIIVNQLAKN